MGACAELWWRGRECAAGGRECRGEERCLLGVRERTTCFSFFLLRRRYRLLSSPRLLHPSALELTLTPGPNVEICTRTPLSLSSVTTTCHFKSSLLVYPSITQNSRERAYTCHLTNTCLPFSLKYSTETTHRRRHTTHLQRTPPCKIF